MAPTIRQAGPDDIPMLGALIRKAFTDVAERFGLTPANCPKHPSNYTSEWVAGDLDRGVTYFILSHDGKPVGCVGLEQAGPTQCYLERLAVLPSHRRRGFGRALVDHVLKRASHLGAAKVAIGIIAGDTVLKDWYAGIGFVEGPTKTFAHLPFEVLFMSKEL
jgi:N-acetylglutamate synthase-like GNAT family acetyltransferase